MKHLIALLILAAGTHASAFEINSQLLENRKISAGTVLKNAKLEVYRSEPSTKGSRLYLDTLNSSCKVEGNHHDYRNNQSLNVGECDLLLNFCGPTDSCMDARKVRVIFGTTKIKYIIIEEQKAG